MNVKSAYSGRLPKTEPSSSTFQAYHPSRATTPKTSSPTAKTIARAWLSQGEAAAESTQSCAAQLCRHLLNMCACVYTALASSMRLCSFAYVHTFVDTHRYHIVSYRIVWSQTEREGERERAREREGGDVFAYLYIYT